MFLSWLNVHAQSVSELLWYLQEHPPPQAVSKITQNPVSVNIKPGTDGVSTAENPVETGQSGPRPWRPPEVDVIKSPSPSLFALLIGINKYMDPTLPDLHGAVRDADEVQNFLISEVGVAKDRIVNLRNEEATREAMMSAIRNLAHDSAISGEDPILIFYAGHGGEAQPPHSGWNTSNPNGMIQMLIPYDFVMKGSNDYLGQGIFDITLSRLLVDIAKNKSDNITVILDSCHSGSGTRKNLRDETFAFRGIKLPPTYTIPSNVFGSEELERATSIAYAHEKAGLGSHVLLAACMQGQTAKERQGHGAFTLALLTLLKEEGIDQLTYQDVITRMPDLPLQNPQCEGLNKTRVLFNSKVANAYRNLYLIGAASDKAGEYILEAGEAHGIANKAEFAVYSDKKMSSRIGSVVALDATPFTTRCSVVNGTTPFALPQFAYAVQTRVGEEKDIRLFIEANDAFLDLFLRLGEEMQRIDTNRRSFRLVNNASEEPDLAISACEGLVQLHVMEKICREYGLTRMPVDDIRVDETEYLISIISSAADFYWNLHHSNKKKGVLAQKVTLECLKLVPSGDFTDDLEEILVPKPNDRNLNIGGTIVIDVDEDLEYGFKITNTSTIPLYAALFYFDVSDLSIVAYYLPGMAAKRQVEFSLPASRSLTIGYGDSGTPPPKYSLGKNESIDVGFLKLYVSTEFIDYSGIAQNSPFQRTRASNFPQPKKRSFWDTLTIPIIQKRSDRPFVFETINAGDHSEDFGAGFGAQPGAKLPLGLATPTEVYEIANQRGTERAEERGEGTTENRGTEHISDAQQQIDVDTNADIEDWDDFGAGDVAVLGVDWETLRFEWPGLGERSHMSSAEYNDYTNRKGDMSCAYT